MIWNGIAIMRQTTQYINYTEGNCIIRIMAAQHYDYLSHLWLVSYFITAPWELWETLLVTNPRVVFRQIKLSWWYLLYTVPYCSEYSHSYRYWTYNTVTNLLLLMQAYDWMPMQTGLEDVAPHCRDLTSTFYQLHVDKVSSPSVVASNWEKYEMCGRT